MMWIGARYRKARNLTPSFSKRVKIRLKPLILGKAAGPCYGSCRGLHHRPMAPCDCLWASRRGAEPGLRAFRLLHRPCPWPWAGFSGKVSGLFRQPVKRAHASTPWLARPGDGLTVAAVRSSAATIRSLAFHPPRDSPMARALLFCGRPWRREAP